MTPPPSKYAVQPLRRPAPAACAEILADERHRCYAESRPRLIAQRFPTQRDAVRGALGGGQLVDNAEKPQLRRRVGKAVDGRRHTDTKQSNQQMPIGNQ